MRKDLEKIEKAIEEIESDNILSTNAKLVILNVLQEKVFELRRDISNVDANIAFYEHGFKQPK